MLFKIPAVIVKTRRAMQVKIVSELSMKIEMRYMYSQMMVPDDEDW